MDIETRGIWLRLKFSVLVFLLVLLVGTAGFRLLEPSIKSLLDSFFFTLVTVTTIGYGNITPQTLPGKVLDIIVIFVGVGAALLSVQTVFEAVIRKRIMEVLKLPKGAVDMKDHFIVCGYGKVGKPLVKKLRQEGVPFVVVESEDRKVKELVDAGVSVIEGDARKEDVLERAGIRAADYLLAALDDASNVFVTLTAKMLNPPLKVICKIEDIENQPKLKKAGADEVVSCHDMGAKMMLQAAKENAPKNKQETA
ncbi:MAG: NAD-binding protein [Deltaproteobacteria bacterium]|nr:NAD-binding protein [Deltaproteobacteria bacterium]